MKIEKSHECSHSLANTIETLKLIYMECPRTQNFDKMVVSFIKIELNYDFNGGKLYQITCCQENIAINYFYLAANRYVGRKLQYGKRVKWDEFQKNLKSLLVGEKTAVTSVLENLLSWVMITNQLIGIYVCPYNYLGLPVENPFSHLSYWASLPFKDN